MPVATCSLHSRPALCTSTSQHSEALCCAFAAAGWEALSASGSTWSTKGVVPVAPAHYAACVSCQSYIRPCQRPCRPHGPSEGHFVSSKLHQRPCTGASRAFPVATAQLRVFEWAAIAAGSLRSLGTAPKARAPCGASGPAMHNVQRCVARVEAFAQQLQPSGRLVRASRWSSQHHSHFCGTLTWFPPAFRLRRSTG